MELHHLRSFTAVAREGKLNRAAVRLFLSQPAVSAHIKALEEELGVELFARTSRGMRLTQAGSTLLAEAEEALASVRALEDRARGLRSEVAGVLRLGLNTGPDFLRVPAVLADLAQRHPGLTHHLERSHSPLVEAAIHNGELDVGFSYVTGAGLDKELGCLPLARVRLAVVAPFSWRERLSGADWNALLDLPWVWVTKTCAYHRCFAHAAGDGGGSSPREVVVDDEATLRALVASGTGLTLLREDEARAAEAGGELCVLDPAGAEPRELTLRLVWRAQRQGDPLIRAVVSAVAQAWAA